ncbi:uncharacterized protein DEA37_0014653 [Paragonimus westermani]|uniref:SH3 domain-containing protein n=1 Tax=Paragonimus westermani TaxID=34504 RepID=A0A5J4NSY7_9TREM|nr:uncharacterized protein DEA37_0014653 [Paragonimus westermani]
MVSSDCVIPDAPYVRMWLSLITNVCRWYFGEIGRVETNEILIDQPVGTYLVRDSTTQSGYALDVKPAPKPVYIGLHNLQSKNETDLSFSRGDRLYFIRQKQKWLLCKCESGQIGWVPLNYLVPFSPDVAAQLSGQTDRNRLPDCRKGEFLKLPATAKVIRARLGKTVPELGDLSGIPVIPKTSFSMYTEDVANVLELGKEIDSILLCGIETHVCVQATALDLVERGAEVHCITDACSSRNMVDRMVAFHRMSQAGVYLTTCESALLSILCGSHHPSFREIQKIILKPSPDSGLLSGVAPANPFVGLNN